MRFLDVYQGGSYFPDPAFQLNFERVFSPEFRMVVEIEIRFEINLQSAVKNGPKKWFFDYSQLLSFLSNNIFGSDRKSVV